MRDGIDRDICDQLPQMGQGWRSAFIFKNTQLNRDYLCKQYYAIDGQVNTWNGVD